MEITLATPGVSTYFTQAPGNAWHCPSKKSTMGGAILEFYRKFGNAGLCGLSWLGLPLTSEIGISGKPGVVYQRFERAVLIFDPSRSMDNPPGAPGQVYLAHIDAGIGQDPRIAQLAIDNADLKKQNDTFQKLLNDDEQAKVIAAQKAKMERAIDVLME